MRCVCVIMHYQLGGRACHFHVFFSWVVVDVYMYMYDVGWCDVCVCGGDVDVIYFGLDYQPAQGQEQEQGQRPAPVQGPGPRRELLLLLPPPPPVPARGRARMQRRRRRAASSAFVGGWWEVVWGSVSKDRRWSVCRRLSKIHLYIRSHYPHAPPSRRGSPPPSRRSSPPCSRPPSPVSRGDSGDD